MLMAGFLLAIVMIGIAAFVESAVLLGAGVVLVALVLLVSFLSGVNTRAAKQARLLSKESEYLGALSEMDRLSIDDFTERIAEALRREKNQVVIEDDGHERRLLRITNRGGTSIIAMVKKTSEDIDIHEVQRLHDLATEGDAKVAYLFTNEKFTPEAQRWATGKSIHLADEDALQRFGEETGIDWKHGLKFRD